MKSNASTQDEPAPVLATKVPAEQPAQTGSANVMRAPILASEVGDEAEEDLDLDDEPAEVSPAHFAALFSGPAGRSTSINLAAAAAPPACGSVRMLAHTSALPGFDALPSSDATTQPISSPLSPPLSPPFSPPQPPPLSTPDQAATVAGRAQRARQPHRQQVMDVRISGRSPLC